MPILFITILKPFAQKGFKLPFFSFKSPTFASIAEKAWEVWISEVPTRQMQLRWSNIKNNDFCRTKKRTAIATNHIKTENRKFWRIRNQFSWKIIKSLQPSRGSRHLAADWRAKRWAKRLHYLFYNSTNQGKFQLKM